MDIFITIGFPEKRLQWQALNEANVRTTEMMNGQIPFV